MPQDTTTIVQHTKSGGKMKWRVYLWQDFRVSKTPKVLLVLHRSGKTEDDFHREWIKSVEVIKDLNPLEWEGREVLSEMKQRGWTIVVKDPCTVYT